MPRRPRTSSGAPTFAFDGGDALADGRRDDRLPGGGARDAAFLAHGDEQAQRDRVEIACHRSAIVPCPIGT
jgi:hypothetical protein